MSHFPDDLYHKTSTRLGQIVPNYIENLYPQFFEFLKLYYEFLEQYDENPSQPTYTEQSGVVSVIATSSDIIGTNTNFLTLVPYQKIKIGSDVFSVRTIINATNLITFEVATQTQYGVTFLAETNKSIRQASGALRQLLRLHDVNNTLSDLIPYFRDKFLRDLPEGASSTQTLIPRILDFYRARGSEDSYKFLFRILYGEDLTITYPRDFTFKTSDGKYSIPQILKVYRDTILYGTEEQYLTQNVNAFLGREIVGLTSGLRARIAQVREEQDGPTNVITFFIEDVTMSTETSRILLNTEDIQEFPPELSFTDFGVPPAQKINQIYKFSAVTEEKILKDFLPDEYIATLPLNDPYKIQASVAGVVTGFKIIDGGQNYVAGDLIFVPPNHLGGYSAVGRVAGFANSEIQLVTIDDGGDGYYPGLPLVVDNSGTGGTGLAGVVTAISLGNILLETGSYLLFEIDEVSYRAEQETSSLYELNESLQSVLSWSLLQDSNLLNDNGDRILWDGDDGYLVLHADTVANIADGDRLVFMIQGEDGEEVYTARLEITAIGQEPPLLNASDWSVNWPTYSLYQTNFSTLIAKVLSIKNAFPIFINGVQTAIGRVKELEIVSFGQNYIFGLPVVSVARPVRPTTGSGDFISRAILPFINAVLTPVTTPGRIASLTVFNSGGGYKSTSFDLLWPSSSFSYFTLFAENAVDGTLYNLQQELTYAEEESFNVTANETSSLAGTTANVAIVVGGISTGQPRLENTAGQASSSYKLQDITYYQPFSYELTTESSPVQYESILKRLVHPAGGLLIPVQSITSNLNMNISISNTYIDQAAI